MARRIIVSEAKIAVPFVTSSPDPEVPAKAQRRKFSAEDKKRILEERRSRHAGTAASAPCCGGRESIPRRCTAGARNAIAAVHKAFSQKRGPQPQRNPLAGENEKLRRQNQRLQEELEKAHIVIDVQKKVAKLLGYPTRRDSPRGEVIMTALDQLRPLVGMKRACQALSVPRATWYRRSETPRLFSCRPRCPRNRSGIRRERFPIANSPPCWRAFMRSVFRIARPRRCMRHCSMKAGFIARFAPCIGLLETHGESRERRDQLTHPPYQKPELLATQANQLWSWDITKLRGPVKWTCYHLYVILDVFSRYVVGWMIAYRESAELAKRLIEHTCRAQNIAPGQLTVHADRGSSMKSKPVALLLADLGVVKTHSAARMFPTTIRIRKASSAP